MDDDLQYARIAARSLRIRLTEVEVDPSDIVDNIEKMVSDLDEPLADPAAMSLYFM